MNKPRDTIRTFALVCVAITSVFVLGMIVWYTTILTGRDWCVRAMGAAQLAERPESAISNCFSLLSDQVAALAWNSHIFVAIIALCLLVLMVIVVADGEVSFKAGKTGVEGHIGREVEEAAQFVADEAQEAADKVAETPAKPKVDDPDGGP